MKARQSHLEFLASAGAAQAPHVHGSLLEHLLGTHRLLSEWQCEEHVCVAGLFHSIYSTSLYTCECVSVTRRSEMTFLIGERAERLAFFFCASARPGAFLEALEGASLENRLDGTALPVADGDLSELVEIECANLLEQGLGYTFLNKVMQDRREGKIGLRRSIARAVETALHSGVLQG